MKKALKVIAIILLILLVLGIVVIGGAVWYVNRYVQAPEFKQQMVGLASKATGTKVQLDELKVSIFTGVELRGVAIGNPEGFTGDLMTAKEFTLHYKLWPLLHGQVDVQKLALETPVIQLVRNSKGEWNYDKIGNRTAKVKSAAEPASGDKPSAKINGMEVSLSNLEMKQASVVMVTDTGKELLKIQNASFASTINLAGDKLSGDGQAKIELVNASNALFIHNVATPVAVRPESVKLSPLTGTVADGAITGDATMSLAGDSRYTLNLQIMDADVVKLIKESGVGQALFSSGKLQINTSVTGTGGVETIVGNGKIEVTGGQLSSMPILNLVATVLQTSALQNLKFDECLIQYTISNNVMETPVISLKSPQVQIAGKGSVSLADNSLNHTFTITLASAVMDRTPKEIRQEMTKHDDGSYSMEFKVWGPSGNLKTDLEKRLLKAAGNQLLQQGLKLLK